MKLTSLRYSTMMFIKSVTFVLMVVLVVVYANQHATQPLGGNLVLNFDQGQTVVEKLSPSPRDKRSPATVAQDHDRVARDVKDFFFGLYD